MNPLPLKNNEKIFMNVVCCNCVTALFCICLTLFLIIKALITTAADIFLYTSSFFSEKIRPDILCESSARQRIHMKLQALFSAKNKSKKN